MFSKELFKSQKFFKNKYSLSEYISFNLGFAVRQHNSPLNLFLQMITGNENINE